MEGIRTFFQSLDYRTILFCLWLSWNVFTFLLMGFDKLMAKLDKRRISEAALLITAFAMGALGALCGSKLFHHKTRKKKFVMGLPAALLLNAVIAAGIFYLTHR